MPKFEEGSHEETLHQEGCARIPAWNLAKEVYKLNDEDKTTFYSPVDIKAPVLISKTPQERMLVTDSGASMHTLSKKYLSSAGLDTLRRSRNPTTVITTNGKVRTNEEAQVYVHDLDLFVTVQLLKETLAVLSLGKLCEEHGYSYEWVSGQKPHLTKQGKKIHGKTDNFVPLVVPGLSTNSGTSSSSASTSQDSSSSSSNPVLERSDGIQETSAIPQKNKTKNIKMDDSRDSDDRLRDLPEWLEEFTEIQRTQNCLHLHTCLRTQIRNALRKWYQNQGSTVRNLLKDTFETGESFLIIFFQLIFITHSR